MAITVDSVCTHAQLDEFLGGQLSAGQNLVPGSWSDSEPARQFALDTALEALRRRTPPIFEADLDDVTELRRAVLYGASERLYDLAMTSAANAELFYAKSKRYGELFENELNGLTPTLTDGLRGSTRSIGISRR